MKRILILGGDGYLGWPTAMYFSSKGYKVTVVDNYFRRHVCDEVNISILYKVPTLVDRAKIWHELTGLEIKVVIGDLSNPQLMKSLFSGEGLNYQYSIDNNFSGIPETVVHYAEQPSAPYSQMNFKTSSFTLTNNLLVTNNLMFAIKEYSPETHLVKLGTMGEYGTPNIDIEEGWIEVEHKDRKDKFLFPRQANSMYHTTKIMDTDLLWFGVRMWGLKVTDLMQGPVYGIETEECLIDTRLRTIFNYDELFGTIINRFIVQAIVGYPLTVYGKGEQTRGYINIKDTLQCVHIAELNPPESGVMNIYNQITETFTVNQIATLTQKVGIDLGYDVSISHIDNPRKELENHYYNPIFRSLVELGVKPHFLDEEAMAKMFNIISEYKSNIKVDTIFKGVRW